MEESEIDYLLQNLGADFRGMRVPMCDVGQNADHVLRDLLPFVFVRSQSAPINRLHVTVPSPSANAKVPQKEARSQNAASERAHEATAHRRANGRRRPRPKLGHRMRAPRKKT
jgi:hypothetical protein